MRAAAGNWIQKYCFAGSTEMQEDERHWEAKDETDHTNPLLQ